jgi:ribonuclease P protein component
VLPAASRLHTADEFAAVVRSGRRAGTPRVIVHLLRSPRSGAPRAGFVVSGKVGNSVIRHRVTRRLRPLVREALRGLPDGTDVVVRALPTAAVASSGQLADDLSVGLAGAARKAGLSV